MLFIVIVGKVHRNTAAFEGKWQQRSTLGLASPGVVVLLGNQALFSLNHHRRMFPERLL